VSGERARDHTAPSRTPVTASSGSARDRDHDSLLDAVERSQERKLRSRRDGRPEIARGLGTSGIIGWSVAVPTLLGIALGVWLDRRVDSDYAWTLVLLAAGLLIGGITAWYWAGRELDGDH